MHVYQIVYLFIIMFLFTAKMIGLPPVFLHENGIGGGVIQVSAAVKTILGYFMA